jgi:hypothetical protein
LKLVCRSNSADVIGFAIYFFVANTAAVRYAKKMLRKGILPFRKKMKKNE